MTFLYKYQLNVQILEDVAKLMTEDNTLPAPLDSAEHWTMYWRDMVKSIDFGKSGFYDIALFIFCMLN